MQKNLQSLIQPQNPPCTPLTKGGKNFHEFHKLLNAHYEASLARQQSQQNLPCVPLTKGGKNFHEFHKLLNAHYKTGLAPFNKGGWGDSNPFHPLVRQEESQPCN
jgi:hypothetical protein